MYDGASSPGRGLGPRPVGDPDGMRDLAAALRAEAGRLARFERLDLSGWKSAKASEVRCRLQAFATGVQRASDDLEQLAAALLSEADFVEQEQLDWTTRKALADARSEERRVGKECRSRGSPHH